MKNLFILLAVFLTISCGNISTAQAPDAVKEAFQKKYPNENDPDWHQDKNGYYEANFKKDGEHFRADYKEDGSWVETESSIKKKDLPKAVRDRIKKEYDDYKIYEIEKVDHHSKGRFYDVEFKIDGKKKDIEFNEQGEKIN